MAARINKLCFTLFFGLILIYFHTCQIKIILSLLILNWGSLRSRCCHTWDLSPSSFALAFFCGEQAPRDWHLVWVPVSATVQSPLRQPYSWSLGVCFYSASVPKVSWYLVVDSCYQSMCLHSSILAMPFESTSPESTSVPTWRSVVLSTSFSSPY